jgi:FtsH-binding integral membrane protein
MEPKLQDVRSGGDGGTRRAAVDLEDSKPRNHHMIPVWFFVGVILLIYGLIILGTGIYEFSSPPLEALSSMPPAIRHPAVWWGALLAVIGGIYVYLYMPKKS